ncbi:receptor-like protein EIX2 [Vigna umbellata]|uniref:receptor-like protein EIX2 n=1 Tax=Vigna umbellata TaxID=87088 RepID=UPI001F5E46D6|nr:receptor-like protein EIX2 [Vigna umbellata]
MSTFGVCRETVCIPNERETLLKLKHHLNDSSNRLSSWNETVDSNCCNWVGVVCNNITAHVAELHLSTPFPTFRDALDENAYAVTNLEAYEEYTRSQFGGEINPCLVDLKHLNYLDFSGNRFESKPIPSFIAAITSLTHLNLSYSGFMGIIPPEIGNLCNLIYLDLSDAASGTVPSQIGNLSNLLYLDLSSSVSGTIPSRMGNLSNLLYLDLGNNNLFIENVDWLSSLSELEYLDLKGANLSQSFHFLHTLQVLPSLMHLHLLTCTLPYHNQPSFLNFSSLLSLDLSAISHSSSISFALKWAFELKKLVSLTLSSNNIEGSIFDDIRNLTFLENLDLSFNSFSSSIPDWIYIGLPHLKFLDLSRNNLQGTISDALGNVTSLITLDLSGNQLEGPIPSSIEKVTSLVTLDLLDDNKIGGELPKSLGKLSSLISLRMSKNQFSGNPFEILRSLSKLSYLEIGDNCFEGIVKEDHLENLTRIRLFDASGSNLTLKVAPNWHPTFHLRYLDISSWQLRPNIPPWLQSQNTLQYLAMSNTGISDSVPTWFWENFSSLQFLNLSNNHIHGEIAKSLRNPISFTVIDLSSNHLYGELPFLSNHVLWLDLSNNSFSKCMNDFLCCKQCKKFSLYFLNLASNNLSGKIPDCWTKWPDLVDVYLQSNHFVGNLPSSMGSLVLLQSLSIRNNSLSGIFPTSLKKNFYMISLDLGENNLSGTIPSWIGESLLRLKILRLRSNNFSGDIPNEMCDMIFLQNLDLAHNSLSGHIPNCFNHFKAILQKNKSPALSIYSNASTFYTGYYEIGIILWIKGRATEYSSILGLVTNIDLSDNNLSGGIPKEITELDGLIYLNLSKNQLSGQIPLSIGNMRMLESIDISKNQLSGEIPPTISNLNFLSYLDLSHNHLEGKIPTGTQIQSFEASNFVGNNLCGPPLLINCSSNKEIPFINHSGMENDGHEVNWFFVSMALGFIVGFWIVVAPLFIYRSWRYAYFCFLDDLWYKLQTFW